QRVDKAAALAHVRCAAPDGRSGAGADFDRELRHVTLSPSSANTACTTIRVRARGRQLESPEDRARQNVPETYSVIRFLWLVDPHHEESAMVLATAQDNCVSDLRAALARIQQNSSPADVANGDTVEKRAPLAVNPTKRRRPVEFDTRLLAMSHNGFLLRVLGG